MQDINLEVATQSGDTHRVEAPPDMSGEEFIRGLINLLRLPTTDAEGRPINWRVDNKDTGRTLEHAQTLEAGGVREGHHLSIIRTVTAGCTSVRGEGA
jgi:hypothetical protein